MRSPDCRARWVAGFRVYRAAPPRSRWSLRCSRRCSSRDFWRWERMEVFKFLLSSFFPLAILILMVLGSIVFGFATPTEAAAVGALGGLILAAAYRLIEHWRSEAAKSTAVARTIRELGGII